MVTNTDSGSSRFRVFLPHAASVAVIGGFTDWEEAPAQLTPDSDGWWTGELRLGPGEHEFAYLVDARRWMPDYAANGLRRDQRGVWISTLTVAACPTVTVTETAKRQTTITAAPPDARRPATSRSDPEHDPLFPPTATIPGRRPATASPERPGSPRRSAAANDTFEQIRSAIFGARSA